MYHFDLTPGFFSPLNQWEKDMERVFRGPNTKEAFYTPACEIRDEEKQFTVSLDVPGLKQEELEIEVKDNRLHVTGERKVESKVEQDHVVRTEKRYGKFTRVFSLPQHINTDGIEASVENGVLMIMIPKEEKTHIKKITISGRKPDTDAGLN